MSDEASHAAVNSDHAKPQLFDHVAIIGCGLIGGSFAIASREAGATTITISDRDPLTREQAVARGIADAAYELPSKAAAGAGLVVLALPVAGIPDAAEAVALSMNTHAVLTDVGSVKSQLIVEVERRIPAEVHFIGGHPMAGSHEAGIGAANGKLFQGATYALTPTSRADPDSFQRLAAHVRAIGARVLAIDPDTHDQLVAVTSHLPHVVASVLMNFVSDHEEEHAGMLATAAGGFRDVTRVAAGDPGLWLGILDENRVAVAAALDSLATKLAAVGVALADRDKAGLLELLEQARDARRALPSGAVGGDLVDVVVALTDQPGELARITTALGAAGINIEDVVLRHASDAGKGALVLAVDGTSVAEKACEVLARQHLSTHIERR